MKAAKPPQAIQTPKWFIRRCSICRRIAWPKKAATATAEHSTHPPEFKKEKAAQARPEAAAFKNQS